MNLQLPIPVNVLLPIALACASLLVVAYILKMRRRRFLVPFSLLWQRVLGEKDSTSLWHQLRRLLSLFLLLVMTGLLFLAALEPERGSISRQARSVVFIVDASASMQTRDSGPSGGSPRMLDAIDKTVALIDKLGGDDVAMLLRMDGQATALSRFVGDIPALKAIARSIEATDSPADLTKALASAANALRKRQRPLIIIVGDGAYATDQLQDVLWENKADNEDAALSAVNLAGIEVQFLPVGTRTDNVGITAFNVRRYLSNKLNYEAYVEVQNTSESAAQRKLVLYSGDSVIDVKNIALEPKERLAKVYRDLGGAGDGVLRARLEPVGDANDPFALDDTAWALVPKPTRQSVLLVSEDNLYLEGALLVVDTLDVDKLAPAEYERRVSQNGLKAYDVAIYHGYTPDTALPSPTNLLYFHPQGDNSPFPVQRTLSPGQITDTHESHPVTRWLELSDAHFDNLSSFAVDSAKREVSLARSIRLTVAAARNEERRKVVAFGFGLNDSDIMLRTSFVLLIVNTMDWFSGTSSAFLATFPTGTNNLVPVDARPGFHKAILRLPGGRDVGAPLSTDFINQSSYVSFYTNKVGVHQLTVHALENPTQVVTEIPLAANLSNPRESDIAPQPQLRLGGALLPAPKLSKLTSPQPLWSYLVLGFLVLLFVEWATYHRRITV